MKTLTMTRTNTMKTLKRFALLSLISLLPACGQQLVEFHKPGTTDAGNLGDGGDKVAPVVTTTNPASDATGAALTATVSATFSEAMDPVSIDGQTFTVKQGSTDVVGTVTYDADNGTATFTPTSDLAANTTYKGGQYNGGRLPLEL
jgi:Bacterial Ig-like domain